MDEASPTWTGGFTRGWFDFGRVNSAGPADSLLAFSRAGQQPVHRFSTQANELGELALGQAGPGYRQVHHRLLFFSKQIAHTLYR